MTRLLLVALALAALVPTAAAEACVGAVCVEAEPVPIPECASTPVGTLCGNVLTLCTPTGVEDRRIVWACERVTQ